MNDFYQIYLNRLDEVHSDINQAIKDLPQAALDWIPSEGMNSINVMIFHLTGAERYWIGDVAMRDPSERDRAAEFRVKGIPLESLLKRLADTTAYAHHAVAQLTLQDLEQERTSPRDGSKFTVAWALLHSLEHSAIHLGHIQLTRQLWDQQLH